MEEQTGSTEKDIRMKLGAQGAGGGQEGPAARKVTLPAASGVAWTLEKGVLQARA